MTSFDETKRQTLKAMAGTGASLVAGSLGVVSVADAALASASPAAAVKPTNTINFDLDLNIVSSNGVVENSLILKNNTEEAMKIARFRSETIVFNNRSVSLASITENGPITIEPGQTLAFDVSVDGISDSVPMEYVYANQCVTQVSDDCIDVNLGGFLADHDVMLVTGMQKPVDVSL